MANPLEVLGISKEVVEYEKSTNSLDNLLKLVERNFSTLARLYHPDVSPATADMYVRFTSAVQELRVPAGLRHAVQWYVGEDNRAIRLRHKEAARERQFDRESLLAGFGLLRNINQFKVMGVNKPTSFMLQFGPARTVLDVKTHDTTFLGLSAQEASEVLPEQSEAPEYTKGVWVERYLDHDGEEAQFVHKFSTIGRVNVVGFVPAREFRSRDSEGDVIHHDDSELGEGPAQLRVAPSWSAPETAWYLPKLVPEHTEHAHVVVRQRNGHLALVGTVQAQA